MFNQHSSDPAFPGAAPGDDAGRAAEWPEPATLWRIRHTGQVERVISVTTEHVLLESLGSGTQTIITIAEFGVGRVFVGRLRSGD